MSSYVVIELDTSGPQVDLGPAYASGSSIFVPFFIDDGVVESATLEVAGVTYNGIISGTTIEFIGPSTGDYGYLSVYAVDSVLNDSITTKTIYIGEDLGRANSRFIGLESKSTLHRLGHNINIQHGATLDLDTHLLMDHRESTRLVSAVYSAN